MKSLLLGAGVGAVVVFMWGFVFWGVLPVTANTVETVADQASVQQLLKTALPATGTYLIPYSPDPQDAEFQKLYKGGPIATVHIRSDGSEPMAPSTMLLGFLHGFAVLLLMGLALLITRPAGFGQRLMLVFLGGVAGSLLAQLSGPIWWLEPWPMAVMNAIYQAVAWFLGGLVLAYFVKPAGRRDVNAM